MLDHLHNEQADKYVDKLIGVYDFCFKSLINNNESAKSDFLQLANYIKKLDSHKQFKTLETIGMTAIGAVVTYAFCNQITDTEIIKVLFATLGGGCTGLATHFAESFQNFISYYLAGKSDIHRSLIESTKYHSNVPKMYQMQIDDFNTSEYSSYICGLTIAAAALDDKYVASLTSNENTMEK